MSVRVMSLAPLIVSRWKTKSMIRVKEVLCTFHVHVSDPRERDRHAHQAMTLPSSRGESRRGERVLPTSLPFNPRHWSDFAGLRRASGWWPRARIGALHPHFTSGINAAIPHAVYLCVLERR